MTEAEARERAAAMLAEVEIVLTSAEFSTRSRDESDVFTDPRVVR